MGPRKAKQKVKLKNTTFYSIVYTGYKLHQLVAPPPPKNKRRARAHRSLGKCDRMHEQTDFSTFSAKKAQKGRYSPKNAIKGERKGVFPKGKRAKNRASTFGKGLTVITCLVAWNTGEKGCDKSDFGLWPPVDRLGLRSPPPPPSLHPLTPCHTCPRAHT